jgi:hypothetical protein
MMMIEYTIETMYYFFDNNTETDSLSLSLFLFWRLGFKSQQTTETTRSCQFLVSSLGSVVVMLLLLFCSEVAS